MKYPDLLSIRPRKVLTAAATFMLAAAFIGSYSARAANYYWAPTPGILGGNGNWATSGATNWTTDSAGGGTHVSWHNTTADTALFNGTDGTYTVTLGTTLMNFGGITFNASGYTLSAISPSTLASTASPSNLTIASGKTVTIGNNVTLSPTGGNGLNLTGGGTVVFDSGSAVSTPTRVWIGGQSTPTNTVNTATVVKLEAGASMTATVQDLVVNATFLIEGGTASAAGSLFIGQQPNSATATNVTMTSGSLTATSGIRFGSSTNIVSHGGTLNLDGGTLTTRKIFQTALITGISSTMNFDGGTLKPTATDNTTFLTGLDTVQIRNNGAKIDTSGFDVTIGQALTHSVVSGDNAMDGGLTKQGAGILTVSGANTYTGGTSVEAGTLKLASNASIAGTTLSISNGAVLDVSALSGGYSLSTINLTIETDGTTAGLLNANNIPLTLGGNLVINFSTASLGAGGTFNLISFSGGSETGDFSGVSLAGSFSGSLVNSAANIWTGTNGSYRFTFDQTTGNLLVAIPEPGTCALAIPALLALLMVRRKSRRHGRVQISCEPYREWRVKIRTCSAVCWLGVPIFWAFPHTDCHPQAGDYAARFRCGGHGGVEFTPQGPGESE